MANQIPPITNLDLDLLRTFVAVADLNTFAAAANEVSRTQSAVSQQMQRLEHLVDRELFARQGRNKLLTEHGIQLLGYARKILRFNDDACASLLYSDVQGKMTIGVTEDTSETLLPYVLNRITTLYPSLQADIRITKTASINELLDAGEIDLAITTQTHEGMETQLLRTSPTLWYCAADYTFQYGEPVPLVIQQDKEFFREMAMERLNFAKVPWVTAYIANSLSAIKVAVKGGLGITARPAEMLTPELRVLGHAEGLPQLPDTQYFLCRRADNNHELLIPIFNMLTPQSEYNLQSGSAGRQATNFLDADSGISIDS